MAAGPQNPNQAIDVMVPITVTHVVLMIVLAVLVIAGIWWGTVLQRRRKAAQTQVDEDFAVAEEHGATTQPTALSSDGAVGDDVPTEPAAPAPVEARADAQPATPVASDLTQIKGSAPNSPPRSPNRGSRASSRLPRSPPMPPQHSTRSSARSRAAWHATAGSNRPACSPPGTGPDMRPRSANWADKHARRRAPLSPPPYPRYSKPCPPARFPRSTAARC